MATISVGEFLVRCLKAEGVELMAGIIDGAHIPIVVHTPQAWRGRRDVVASLPS